MTGATSGCDCNLFAADALSALIGKFASRARDVARLCAGVTDGRNQDGRVLRVLSRSVGPAKPDAKCRGPKTAMLSPFVTI